MDRLIYLKELFAKALTALDRADRDSKQVMAFYADWREAYEAAGPEEKLLLAAVGLRLASKAPKRFSFDPAKPIRLEADNIARALGFERYKALRKL